MGEMEGSYRALQTPGTRLGAQFNAGISTLEPGQNLSTALGSGGKGQGRGLQIRVQGLDDTQEFFDMESKVDGQTLHLEVFRRCNLIESDYFGLEFQNMQMNWVWLELNKLLVKQVRRPGNTLFRLSVKFFPPDPGQLQEEYTRYLFSLQVKRDLADGRLSCSENTGALLASHLLQSELGDYDDVADRDFLRVNKLLPYQEKVQDRILELHSRHLGQTPAESDFQVLEIARKLEMYGVRLHPASDREGTRISLAVAHLGLQVFQGNTKINTFNWSKIRKLSFKRKRFLIKLHPEVHGPHQDTLEFMMASRDQCKIFWKNCVEHHSFFRLFEQPQPKSRAVFFSRGSSFRYSGRTQKQLVEYVRESGARRTPYQRRNSKVRMSARSLASDVPKQSLSFSDSLRMPGSPASGSVSFHSMHLSSPPARFQPQHSPGPSLGTSPSFSPSKPPEAPLQPQAPQSARPSSPPKEDPVKAPPPHPAVQGAPTSRAAALLHPSVCVESSPSQMLPPHSGAEHPEQGGRRGAGFYVGGGGVERKRFLTSEAFEAEILRAGQKPGFCLPPSPLQVTEEFIDDDPTEMSFYGGGAEAYACGLRGTGPPRFVYGDPRGPCRSPEDLADPFPCCPRSETSSLANNRSSCSSLDQQGGSCPDASSLLLPGSDAPSEASSMVNFPACSVRSEGSAALQFSDLLEQLEQLSYPPTATEASADSDSDWGSDGGLPPEQNLFYSNSLGGAEGFLLQCHNLQALALGDPPTSPHINM